MKYVVTTPFTDHTGKHAVGDEIEVDKEQVSILLNYGVINVGKAKAPKVEAAEVETPDAPA